MLNSEKAILAMNEIDDSHLESAREMLGYGAGVPGRRPMKKRIITFALAAALILGLGAAADAVYRAEMTARIPEEGTTEYHVLVHSDPAAPPELLHVNFDRTKFALDFDVPAAGRFPVMRAKDLPGEDGSWWKMSFYEMLETAQYFGLPWEMKQTDPPPAEIAPNREPTELLAEAGMDAEAAKSWYTGYLYQDKEKDSENRLRIDLYGGYKLHGQEIILGAFSPEGTEIREIREDIFGEYQLVEVQVQKPDGETDRHLFLFHPEKYWLLQISGTGRCYDFPDLEQIAQNVEIIETDLYVDSYEDQVNFILADLAVG